MKLQSQPAINPKRLFFIAGLAVVSFYALVYRPYKIHHFKQAYESEISINGRVALMRLSFRESDRRQFLEEVFIYINLVHGGWNGIIGMADKACTIGRTQYVNEFYKKQKTEVLLLQKDYEKLDYAIEESIIDSIYLSNYCHKFLNLIR